MENRIRKEWIDALRALAIVLVVLGHQLRGVAEYFIFTSPIKMPLFFAISGYLFKTRNGQDVDFFKNWFRKLIIPWFGLAIIAAIPRLISGHVGVTVFAMNLISGKILWFMPCFVIAEVIHYYIRKFAQTEITVALCCLLITILGFVCNHLDILNFAMINRAFVVQSFFLMGFLFRSHEDMLTRKNWIIGLAAILYVALCILSIFIFGKVSLDVHSNRYYNIPYCYILIGLGLFTLFATASKTNFSNKILSVIGQNTLLTYIWHKEIILIFVFLLGLIKIKIANIIVYGLLKTTWAICVCNLLARYVNKYIPALVGKKR